MVQKVKAHLEAAAIAAGTFCAADWLGNAAADSFAFYAAEAAQVHRYLHELVNRAEATATIVLRRNAGIEAHRSNSR